jgi:hypothetical protein
MSLIVEVMVDNYRDLPGLREKTVEFAGAIHSLDPPRYIFEAVELDIRPIAKHVVRYLPDRLAGSTCLEFPEPLVLEWRSNRLQETNREALRRFFRSVALSEAWAVVLEGPGSQAEEVIQEVGPDLFSGVEKRLQASSEPGLVVFRSSEWNARLTARPPPLN